tara:strand:+ start:1550 stop:2107 length:558 start_codon:yes stop_codon:yes gene_type:complete
MFDEKLALETLGEAKIQPSSRLVFKRCSLDFVSEEYVGWMNDPEIRKGLVSNQSKETTRQDLEDYIRHLGPRTLQLAILREGSHIGNIKIYGDLELHHGRMEIGYLIGDRTQSNKGFATEAVEAVVGWCFEELLLQKVTSHCFVSNRASARVLEKNGFVLEGTLRDHVLWNGKFKDCRAYGKLAH